ncbi:hypothetical protein GEMRC1_002660 [Eukaryota sp. GEM-RC1]
MEVTDTEFDIAICGTGLKECILSGLMSVMGKKVLHIDRNSYYGGECASLNATQLLEHFHDEGDKTRLGRNRDWNVDLIPKFLMSSGELVKILIRTEVYKRYLSFRLVGGAFTVKNNKIYKVPSNDSEALKSPLMGILEREGIHSNQTHSRCRNFLQFIQQFSEENPTAFKGWDLTTKSMRDVFDHFSLTPDTVDFIGHSMALHRDDDYLSAPAVETVKRIRLFCESLARFGSSPYVYPMYGLGDIPQAFARLASVYGGTYMLNTDLKEVIYDDEGKVTGIKAGDHTFQCNAVVGDPSYFSDSVTKVGQTVRAICILNHPIEGTNNVDSCQIIIPQKQAHRHHDIYVSMISSAHHVCPKGKFLAFVSTTVETENPEAELQPGIDLLGDIEEKFWFVSDIFEPTAEAQESTSGVYVSKSYDATAHFETSVADISSLFERLTGKSFAEEILSVDLSEQEI